MTAMESVAASSMSAAASMPRFGDGSVNLQELARQLVEQVVNEVMSTEADMACEDVGTARNGYRDRKLNTCIGTLNLRMPKVRNGCFFPEDVIERYSRTDRALVAAVAEMYRSGVSTRKVEGVAKTLGVDRLSKDQVSRICAALDAEAADLNGRMFGEDEELPYLWLDATYVKCRDGGHVSSTAVVTAIACDGQGYRHMVGFDVVDTESYDSWLPFLRRLRSRGVRGVRLVVSDAHEGLVRAISETFLGAAWQRCIVHLIRDCCRATRSRSKRVRVAKLLSPVFRAKDALAVRALYHRATQMVGQVSQEAQRILVEAEPDALAYLDFPSSHWKRLRTNNVQERCNREIKRRSRVVQVFPSRQSLVRLVGAVVAESDETWSQSRYFAEGKMDEFWSLLEKCGHGDGSEPITDARRAAADEEARKVLDAAGVAMEREAA
jgi:putative transposase